ncbi:MAG: RNA polymerase sigma factor [Acidobacteriia bacterium]|nr:RNA polymerase sigma factor [Terriglobia bacterium]
MSRDATYNDLSRADAIHDDCAEFVLDEEAFLAFYNRTARGLWMYLARVAGDRQLADDLLQETFYRFLRAAATYESESHRRNSLYRIATNLVRDVRRKRLRRPAAEAGGDEIERVAGGGPGATERFADLTSAMSRLKPRERAMLWLAYAEGASHREIAEILGVRPASLKILLFRARHKLASLMGRGTRERL